MGIFKTSDPKYAAIYAEEAAMLDASQLIARALEESGLTRTQLASQLGVSKSEVTARLKGERNITIRNLAKTLHVLGSSLDLMRSVTPPRKSTRNQVVYLNEYRARKAKKIDQDSHAATRHFSMNRIEAAFAEAR